MHVWVTPNAQVGRTAPHLLLINLWGPAQPSGPCARATCGRASTRHQVTQACWPLSIYWNLKTTPSSRRCSQPLPQPQSPRLRPLPQAACPNATHSAHLCHAATTPAASLDTPGPGRLLVPRPPALSLASSLLAQSLSTSYWTRTSYPPGSIPHHATPSHSDQPVLRSFWKNPPKHKSES